MPRICTICIHKQRSAIESALLNGTSFRNIAERFATSTTALFRHKSACIAESLSKATDVKEVVQADTLLARLKSLNAETLAILTKARKDENGELALKAIARVEKQLELEGKLIGELNDAPVVNLNVSIEKLQTIILKALQVHPEARYAVAEALREANL